MNDQEDQVDEAVEDEPTPEEIEALRDGQAEIVGLRADVDLLTLKLSMEISNNAEQVSQLKSDLVESEREHVSLGVEAQDRWDRLFRALYGEDPTDEDRHKMTWTAMFVEVRNRGNLDFRHRTRLADATRELAQLRDMDRQRIQEDRGGLTHNDPAMEGIEPSAPTSGEQRLASMRASEVVMPAVPGYSKDPGHDIVPTTDPGTFLVDLEPGADRFTPVELGGTFRAEDAASLVADPATGVIPGTLTADMIRRGITDARPDIRSGKTVIDRPPNRHADVGFQRPEETERLRSDWREDYVAGRAALADPEVQEQLGPEGAEFGTVRETIRRGVEEVESRDGGS